MKFVIAFYCWIISSIWESAKSVDLFSLFIRQIPLVHEIPIGNLLDIEGLNRKQIGQTWAV